MSDDHYLDNYLSEILPTLGLDAETYAPYVTGYVSLNEYLITLTRSTQPSPEALMNYDCTSGR